MALVICPECGKQFSDKAKACPECACPIEYVQAKQKSAEKSKNTKRVVKMPAPVGIKYYPKKRYNRDEQYFNVPSENNYQKNVSKHVDEAKNLINAIKTDGVKKSIKKEIDVRINKRINVDRLKFLHSKKKDSNTVTDAVVEIEKNEKKKNIKRNKPKLKINSAYIKKIIVLAIICVAIVSCIFGFMKWQEDRYDWSNIHISELLPEPASSKGFIIDNSINRLEMDVYNTTKEDFSNYINLCKKKGYNIDIIEFGDSFRGFNKTGYKLSLSYDIDKNEMNILLEEPMQMENFVWPNKGLATIIPQIEKTEGIIQENNKSSFKAYISDITKKEFNEYIELCINKGFTNSKYNPGELYFTAKNAKEYEIEIEYIGYDTIFIVVNEPIYLISMEIDCEENLIFDTYDIDVYINNELQHTIIHGEKETIDLNLTGGEYKLKFVNSEDEEIANTVELNIKESEKLRFEISCKTETIEVNKINKVKIPISNKNAIKETYTKVYELYKKAGFTDIETKVVKEVSLKNKDKINKVKKIEIDGKTEFNEKNKFFIDSKVVITYGTAEEIKVPDNSDNLKSYSPSEIKKKFKKAGFTNVSIETAKTTTLSLVGDIMDIEIGNDYSFSEYDIYPWNEEVVIIYYVEDEKGLARKAFEDYGNRLYPNGFDCKWFIGLIHEEKTSDGWYFKVEVKFKNVYGEKLNGVAEGIATKSGVKQFHLNY